MLKLYQRETCSYCAPVREYLMKAGLSYININVPKPRQLRAALLGETGAPYIPALVDADTVIPGKLEDNSHILAFLQQKYPVSGDFCSDPANGKSVDRV